MTTSFSTQSNEEHHYNNDWDDGDDNCSNNWATQGDLARVQALGAQGEPEGLEARGSAKYPERGKRTVGGDLETSSGGRD